MARAGASDLPGAEPWSLPLEKAAPRALKTRRRAATTANLIDFTVLLASMLEAGISISQALEAAIQDVADRRGVKGRRWIEVIAAIRGEVEAGGRLSDALARYPDFSDTYVHMVRAGELSGKLDAMLDRMSSFLETDAETWAAVRGAMTYPACMAVVAVGCVVFLLTYIFPKFAAVFQGHEKLLPWPTRFFFALSDFLVHDWPLLVAGLVALVGGALYLRTVPLVRRWLDGVKLDIPVVSYVVRYYVLCRSLKTMGILLEAGVVILETIRIVRDVSGNVHYAEVWDEVGQIVMNGRPLTDGLARSPLFPASTVQIVSAGERTGRIGPMLIRVAERMEKELNRSIKNLTTLIEPIMIVLMGVLVGMIAASLMLPLFRISQVVS